MKSIPSHILISSIKLFNQWIGCLWQPPTELSDLAGAIILTRVRFDTVIKANIQGHENLSELWAEMSREKVKVSYRTLFSLFSSEVLPSFSTGIVVVSHGLIFSVTGTFLTLCFYSSSWNSAVRISVHAAFATGFMCAGRYLFAMHDDITQILGGIFSIFSRLLATSILLEVVCLGE